MEAARVKKHNPWIGVLWTVGVVLVVAGGASVIWQASFYFQSLDVMQNVEPWVEFLRQLVDKVQAPAMTIGFVTICGLLFLHARNHAHKVRRESSR